MNIYISKDRSTLHRRVDLLRMCKSTEWESSVHLIIDLLLGLDRYETGLFNFSCGLTTFSWAHMHVLCIITLQCELGLALK